MIYILTGIIAFIFMFLFDVYTLKNHGLKKKIFGIAGVGLIIYSAVMVTVVSEKIQFPPLVRGVFGVLCILVTFLLIYSLFLELPFVNTYGKNKHNNELVDTGTYALCRHPGVIWFGLLFLSYFFLTGCKLIILAGLIWTCIDVIYVYLQEKLFFCKAFAGYKDYIKTTPMLIPTNKSIRKCLKTIFRRI